MTVTHTRGRELTSEADVRDVLARARVVAVLGAHTEHTRPAFYVPEYMRSAGSRILPVNPALAGGNVFGEPIRSSLTEIDEPVDVVDVFRRAEALPPHLDEILGMKHKPGVVWLQLGIRNDTFARALLDAGIDVIQDRCMLADHRRMGVGRIA
ncbi:MAG: CoA-binding protein [Myxococcota bacterium]